MVYGVLRLINFAHSEIFMIGTFATLFVLTGLGISGQVGALAVIGLLLLLLVVAMAASGGAAVLLERIAYRPLRKKGASRLAALISAIGASLFLQEAFAIWRGRDFIPFPRVMEKTSIFELGTGQLRTDKLLVIV